MTQRGERLPEDWQPNEETIRWAKQRRPDLDITDQVESFKDYWLSKTGASATKLDWTRTFRNWIRNARYQWKPQQDRQPSPSAHAPVRIDRSHKIDDAQAEANRGRIGNLLANLFGNKS